MSSTGNNFSQKQFIERGENLKPHNPKLFFRFSQITSHEALQEPILVTIAKINMDPQNRIAKAFIEKDPIALLDNDELKEAINLLEDNEYLAFSGATIAIGEFENAKCIFADQRDWDTPVAPGAMHFNEGRSELRFGLKENMSFFGGKYDLHSEIMDPSITANFDGMIEENLYLMPHGVVAVPFDPFVSYQLADRIVSGMYSIFQKQPYSINYPECRAFSYVPAKKVRCENQWTLEIEWDGYAKETREGHIFISGKQGFCLSYFRSMKFDCKIEEFIVVNMEIARDNPLNHRVYAYELNDKYELTTRILGYWQSAKWYPNTDPQDTILKHPTTEGFRQAMDFLGTAL